MKRFTETTKWDDPWFIRLPSLKKLLWLYICDRCDASGVIDFCPELAAVQIGGELTEESLSDFGKRVQKLPSGKWQIVKFLPFQYGTVDARCPAHKPVIRQIQSNGLKYPINNLSSRVSNTLKEKEEDKDKDKEGGVRGGNGQGDFEQFWSAYPRKVSRGQAEKAWKHPHPPIDVILASIAKSKQSEQWTRDNGQFIPHPATWLNAKGWEDEQMTKREVKPW